MSSERQLDPTMTVIIEEKFIPGIGLVKVKICPPAYAIGANQPKLTKGHKGRRK